MKKTLAVVFFIVGILIGLMTIYWSITTSSFGATATVAEKGFLWTVWAFILDLLVALFLIVLGMTIWRGQAGADREDSNTSSATQ